MTDPRLDDVNCHLGHFSRDYILDRIRDYDTEHPIDMIKFMGFGDPPIEYVQTCKPITKES
jgi:hypothetical protein